MADNIDPQKRSANMAAIKSRDTKPELFIRKALFKDGFRYRIAANNIPGHPDLYLARYNIAIFVHGCFWHRHYGCRFAYSPKSRVEFWTKKFEDNMKRDAEVKRLLENTGTRVLIIWECAIKQASKKSGNTADLIYKIEQIIRSDLPYAEVAEYEGI